MLAHELIEPLAGDGTFAIGVDVGAMVVAGSLAIEGDTERQRALLLQTLVELTSQPWTDQTLSGVHVLGDKGLDTALPWPKDPYPAPCQSWTEVTQLAQGGK